MAGLTHKATGSGSNYLCLTSDPQAASFPEDCDFLPGLLSGMGWELYGMKNKAFFKSIVPE